MRAGVSGTGALPAIPQRLSMLGAAAAAEHFWLDSAHRCFYLWDYTPREVASPAATHGLVRCLKLKPSQIAHCPLQGYYKVRALVHAARALRALSGGVFALEECTFVPIPGSKLPEDPDYDDRLMRMLCIAFRDTPVQVRELLQQSAGTGADHESATRLSCAQLLRITRCVDTRGIPPPPRIVLVDDVLSSGKHFKVACTLLAREFPRTEICGVFLARVRRRSGVPKDGRPAQW